MKCECMEETEKPYRPPMNVEIEGKVVDLREQARWGVFCIDEAGTKCPKTKNKHKISQYCYYVRKAK